MGPDSGSFQHHARALGLYFSCPSKEAHSLTTEGASGWVPRANLIGPRPKDVLCPRCPGWMHPGSVRGGGGTSNTVSRHRPQRLSPQPPVALNLAPSREGTVLGGKAGACLGFLTLGKLQGFDSRMDTLVRTAKAQIQVRKDIVPSTKRETIPAPGESSASRVAEAGRPGKQAGVSLGHTFLLCKTGWARRFLGPLPVKLSGPNVPLSCVHAGGRRDVRLAY